MRPSALIFKIHGCHATSTSQQDARLPGGDSSYKLLQGLESSGSQTLPRGIFQ